MNCTTPTRQPWPSVRSTSPKAAVDLPLPGPVLTISRPFSRSSWRRPRRPARALRFAIFAVWRSASVSSIVAVIVISPCIGRPATMNTHAVGPRRDALVAAARPHRGSAAPARCRARCRARPRWRPERRAALAPRSSRLEQRAPAASISRSASMRLVSQSVRQSTRTGWPSGRRASAPARSSGASTVRQPLAAARAMQRDALRHLVVEGLRRRDVGPRRRQGCDQPLGMRLLPERAPPSRKVRRPSGKARRAAFGRFRKRGAPCRPRPPSSHPEHADW